MTHARASQTAEAGAAGELRRFGEPSGGAAFPEARFLRDGASLLGFLEGRPGITRILASEPFTPGATEARPAAPLERPAPSAEVMERVLSLDLVTSATPADAPRLVEQVLTVWWDCEDGGAYVEVEVEYAEAEG